MSICLISFNILAHTSDIFFAQIFPNFSYDEYLFHNAKSEDTRINLLFVYTPNSPKPSMFENTDTKKLKVKNRKNNTKQYKEKYMFQQSRH